MTLRTGAIVQALGGQLFGDPDRVIARLAPLDSAQPTELSFLVNPRLAHLLSATQAGCVIVGPATADAARTRAHGGGDCIVADDPHLYFARLTQLWKRLHGGAPRPGIHPSAIVEEGAFVDPTASVGAQCFVGRGARIGAGSVLKPRVTVGEDCVLGARCIVQSGAVIGGDGFGFAPRDGGWEKIEQLGAVRIGDDVEIGANTCIDRGALDDTVIEDGVKLDNLIQIGHNCHIGKHTAMAGCVGVAGSARIGAHCTVGGAGMILGHLTIADHVHISSASIVTRSILKPGHYTGFYPIAENAEWEKNAATLKQIHRLRERVRRLEGGLADRPDES
ncbi:UDP-3-O-(3-hydroxymyristoyl)glucosamine N-acyltransferase [Ottowia sp.]|uniref:UDP-3-O-(3-hydroxymyristoyl)glucosamine N-acyltransferase n=1 Tax=Ottowia sp. TaxID=1898956 RepID=UPI002C923195|nr:UDP-3-O-(3-hydroxymyristoyl)glucosamine N-acyltransferase [Ottowia sp.]HOB67600.1 UDP-3-O-(3-hydroxymyristoyl)glucosamine N-acyltransferase [Ottowia sp.]HPZ57177.1 UDP-3-O-(3-hydroxymyristoyl)glucosamine N-acyltransferase [Ottowia sp.]HQD47031.1 UDP-3-O-(3-hydroxymyristoyl)glucosamine N-acyltransferase [Ottowia sp.]